MKLTLRPFNFWVDPKVFVATLFTVVIFGAFFSGNVVAEKQAERLLDAAVERVVESLDSDNGK